MEIKLNRPVSIEDVRQTTEQNNAEYAVFVYLDGSCRYSKANKIPEFAVSNVRCCILTDTDIETIAEKRKSLYGLILKISEKADSEIARLQSQIVEVSKKIPKNNEYRLVTEFKNKRLRCDIEDIIRCKNDYVRRYASDIEKLSYFVSLDPKKF